MSSARLHRENEECYIPHMTRVGNDSTAIQYARAQGIADGRAGVPTPVPDERRAVAHQTRRPAGAAGARTAHSTEALRGAAIDVVETPVEQRPAKGGRHYGTGLQPMAARNNLDLTLTPRAEEPQHYKPKHGSTFASHLQGAAMNHAEEVDAAHGSGRRPLTGPPTTVGTELVHPAQAPTRVLFQGNPGGPDTAQAAQSHAENLSAYNEISNRSHTSSIFNDPLYPPTVEARPTAVSRRALHPRMHPPTHDVIS